MAGCRPLVRLVKMYEFGQGCPREIGGADGPSGQIPRPRRCRVFKITVGGTPAAASAAR
jgi:hypothetical protein